MQAGSTSQKAGSSQSYSSSCIVDAVVITIIVIGIIIFFLRNEGRPSATVRYSVGSTCAPADYTAQHAIIIVVITITIIISRTIILVIA